MKTLKKILAVSLFFLFPLVQLSAGWVITMSSEDGSGDMVMKFQDNKMIMDMGGAVTVILNANNNTLTWISHPSKKYWTGTSDEFKKQQKEMVKAMTGMDPDQQQEEQPQDQNIQIEKVGSDNILGYPVDHYKISESGTLIEEVWIAPDVLISKEIDMDKLEKMLSAMSGNNDKNYTNTSDYKSLMKKGYSLKSKDYADGEVMMSSVATQVEQKNIPASEFSVAPGYDKVATVTDFFKYLYGQQ